jgi:hypothetical protein
LISFFFFPPIDYSVAVNYKILALISAITIEDRQDKRNIQFVSGRNEHKDQRGSKFTKNAFGKCVYTIGVHISLSFLANISIFHIFLQALLLESALPQLTSCHFYIKSLY